MSKIDETYHKLLQHVLDNGRWHDDPNRKGVKRLNITRYKDFEHDLRTDGFPAITTKELYWKGVVGELIWFLRGDTNIKYLVDNDINIWNKDAYSWNLKNTDPKALEAGTITEKSLKDFLDRSIFNKNSKKHDWGDLGRIYGAQWRRWTGTTEPKFDELVANYNFDQISNLIKNLKEKPLSSEHIVTAWNPAELDDMALPPCHKGFQLMVYELTLEERLGNDWNDNLLNEYSEQELDDELDAENKPKYGFDLVWEQRSVDTFLGR